ncbi:CapA family protein [Noviherbaspirillum agri]
MQADSAPGVRAMFGGDVMLGRNVKECILRFGPDYPLGPIAPLMRDADLTIVNLECAMTPSLEQWPGMPKAFYFGAPPQAIASLAGAGVDMVSLANNHALDFGTEGLIDTLHTLQQHDIAYAGAGADLDEALSPALVERHGLRFGMAAFCDHQSDFAADKHTPGIAWLDFDDESAVTRAWHTALNRLRQQGVDWPILSLHWGPNMVFRPSRKFRRLAHAAIAMGWKILFGHSAHVFQGIELHHGCPIIYAAGDLVDDYYVDPDFRNDHQLLVELDLSPERVRRITLHPVFIERCQTRTARGDEARYIIDWMTVLCKEMGAKVQQDGRKMWIDVGSC